MGLSKKLSNKSFVVYGLGITGKSVINFFKKKKIKNFYAWDDVKKKRDKLNRNLNIDKFCNIINSVDYIVVSPGINFKNNKLKRILIKNKHKIITDIDLLYMLKPKLLSIVVTGTNGKSTTCKIIENILIKKNIDIKLGGNIGKPVLNINIKKNTILIIEASSFQLAYSQFIKPKYALIINLSKDHLDWHGGIQNYTNSKFKIFKNQEKKDFAFLNDKKLIKKFKKENYKSKLKIISKKSYNLIKDKIKNKYLKSKANEENMSYVYELSKFFKINDRQFINASNKFKGLSHRQEIFLKKRNITFINDSKATSFESCKHALHNNKNIYWILGGLPKKGDKFNLHKIKKNINKSYIIGKKINYFRKEIKNKIKIEIAKNMRRALILIFTQIKKKPFEKATVLLSPASASFDQYKNFVDRGNDFKKLTKLYAKKYL